MSACWLKRSIQTFHNFSLRQKLSLAFFVMTLAPLLFATSLAERQAEEILQDRQRFNAAIVEATGAGASPPNHP